MRLIFFLALLLVPKSVLAAPQPLGTLWQKGGDAVIVTPCPSTVDGDASCRALATRHAGTVTPIGAGYIVTRLLWTRPARARGPDVLVRGDWGGSGGNADVFAVTFAPRLAVRAWKGDRHDEVEGRTVRGALHVDLPFNIEFFNGASHADATIVPIPMRWDGDDLAVDFAALVRPPPPSERAFFELALRSELQRWASDVFPAKRLFPPEAPIAHATTTVTVRALIELMLSGHADAAPALLHRAWPASFGRGDVEMGGADAFWNALCLAVTRHPLWTRLRLERLPHADLIVLAAAAAR